MVERFTSWKLRAIPAWIRPLMDWRVMLCPSNTMAPWSAWKKPLMRFPGVVLPAPFDPIRRQKLALPDRQLHSSTARLSPNLFSDPS